MNKVRSLRQSAFASVTFALSILSAEAYVFDDAKVWYRGAVDANGNGVFAPGVGCLPDVLHAADPTYATHGAMVVNADCPSLRVTTMNVRCPYANETLSSVPCLELPQPVTTNAMVVVDGKEYPVVAGMSNGLTLPDFLSGYSGNCSAWSSVVRFRVDEPYFKRYNTISPVAEWGWEWGASGSGVQLALQHYNGSSGSWPVLRIGNETYAHCRDDVYPDDINTGSRTITRFEPGEWVDFAISVDDSARRILAAYVFDVGGQSKRIRTWEISNVSETIYLGIRAYWHKFRLGCNNNNVGNVGVWTNGVSEASNQYAGVFRGAYHQYAFWTRALTLDEMKEAMSNGHPAIFRIGSEKEDVSAIYKKTVRVVNSRGRWEELDTELTAAGQEFAVDWTYRFAQETDLSQVLRLKADAESVPGRVSILVNDQSVASVDVISGSFVDVFVKGLFFKSGVNRLTVRRVDSQTGVLKVNAMELCGSWARGTGNAGDMGHEYMSTNHFDLADGNLAHYHRSLYNRSDRGAAIFNMLCTNTIAFKFAPEMVGDYKAAFQFSTGWKGTPAAFPVRLSLNGTPIGKVDSIAASSEYRFNIPSGLFSEDNVLALSIPNDAEHLVNVTRYRLEIKKEKGLVLFVR